MSDINVNQLLSQLRAASLEAKGLGVGGEEKAAEGADFSNMLSTAINKVNETQLNAGELKTAFDLGDENVSLAQVMVASQKANVSFQAMLQVRNKLISAYQDIMNMQI
jgi:flagellar hook-basal body complex protein FliE